MHVHTRTSYNHHKEVQAVELLFLKHPSLYAHYTTSQLRQYSNDCKQFHFAVAMQMITPRTTAATACMHDCSITVYTSSRLLLCTQLHSVCACMQLCVHCTALQQGAL
jgi:hypothetical protein